MAGHLARHAARSSPRFLALALCSIALLIGSPAGAQYLYLDSNGDGLHTAADVMAPSGATSFDVWLSTDHNRDGSAAVCPSADGPLSFFGYEFILRAANGSVSWNGYVSARPEFPTSLGSSSGTTDFLAGYGGGSLAPGTYRLGTLTVTVASGTPSLAFETFTPLDPSFMTAFISACSGNDLDGTLKLGSDWRDADGAAYGGAANRAPSFTPPAPIAMDEATSRDFPLTASDLDGNPVTFALRAGPTFASVTTTSPGTGTATGNLSLSPTYSDSGTYTLSIGASDGLLETAGDIALHVRNVNRLPSFNLVPMPMVGEGTDVAYIVSAVDPDPDVLSLSIVSGPSYMTLSILNFDYGSISASLRFRPGYFDAGMTTAVLAASDGTDETQQLIDIMIRNQDRPPVLTAPDTVAVSEGEPVAFTAVATDPDGEMCAFSAVGLPAGATFVDDMNNNADFRWLPRYDQAGDYVVMLRADDGAGGAAEHRLGIGVADVASPLALAQPWDIALGEGGTAEQTLYAVDAGGDPLSFLLVAGPSYASVATTDPGTGFATGVVRLAPGFSDAGAATATVRATDGFLTADRTFHIDVADQPPGPAPGGPPYAPPFRVLSTGETPHTVTVGDVNRDGKLDLVACNMNSNAVSVFLALTDSTYDMRRDYPTAYKPHTVVVRDLNRDGIPDLAISNLGANSVSSMMGVGDGTFTNRRDFALGGSPVFAGVEDFDGDGIQDMVSTNQNLGALMFLKGVGDGTFAAPVAYAADAGAHGLAIADLNDDGHPDVVVANDGSHTSSVHIGRGDGTFQPAPILHFGAPHTVAVGDVDGDGTLDLVLSNYHQGTITLCHGVGDGTFTGGPTFETGMDAHASAVADLDQDGVNDIVVVNQGAASASFFMGLGGGAFAPKVDFAVGAGAHSIAIADLNADGGLDVAVSSLFSNTVTLLLNRRPGPVPARAFTTRDDRTIRLREMKSTWTVYVERGPGPSAFDPAKVVLGSVRLESPGTGSVSEIAPLGRKRTLIADRNRNGAPELALTFSNRDLGRLFDRIRGRREVDVAVTGTLDGGRRFRAELTLTVIGGGHPRRWVCVAPNPLNPTGTVTFATSSPGAARVMVVDVQGRWVATLLRERMLPEGEHRLPIRADRGLASGIYFVRVETIEGVSSVRFTVLK